MSTTGFKAITVYRHADGSTFDTHAEVLAHDARQKALVKIRTAFQGANPNGTIANWDRDFVMNPKSLELLRDGCNAALVYHRNHGKLRKTTAKAKVA